MRTLFVVLVIVAAGCAGQPVGVTHTVVETVPAGSVDITPQPGDTVDAQRIAEAKKMGYKLVNQNGEEYFCRTDLKTGSRVQHETVCLTRKQIDDLRQQTQQGLANTLRQIRPPVGH